MANVNGDDNDNRLDGSIFADTINGKGGRDIINARSGADTIIGGLGNDQLSGGRGDDLFLVGDGEADNGEDYNGGEGTDTIEVTNAIGTVDGVLAARFDQSSINSIEILKLTGNIGHNVTISDRTIGDGFAANLQVIGASADDLLRIKSGLDVVIDVSAFQFSNWTGRISIEGDDSDEVIFGSNQAEIYITNPGKDSIHAGGGDDILVVNGAQNQETYDGGSGHDTLQMSQASLNFNAITVQDIEALQFLGSQPDTSDQLMQFRADDFNSNGLASDMSVSSNGVGVKTIQIDMGSEANFSASLFTFNPGLVPGDVVIAINGSNLDDTITGSTANDVLSGGGGADLLIGGGGNDILDGGIDNDFMFGGAGNDVYFVRDNGDIAGEILIGADPGGIDTVLASVTQTLTGFIENLTLTGLDAIDGTGNGLANVMFGNDRGNLLKGLGGSDVLTGGLGADSMNGGAGDDRFVYGAATESGPGAAKRDLITGFFSGHDAIDVSAIDANAGIGGVQHFVEDSNGVLTAGEFRLRVVNGSTLVDFNTDGDATLEMQIFIQNNSNVVAADLIV